MATQAQKDEKVPARREAESSVLSAATPSQMAEKAGILRNPLEDMATSAQLDEKRRNEFVTSSDHPPFVGAATLGQMAEKARNAGGPPALPPREAQSPAPPPYSSDDAKRSELISEQWRSRDPRSSSTHSLVPSESLRDGRRKLLLVFIHGFMGNETSFQSFPAHIHNLLTITLAETHVVHTKIYPRYKSRKNITFARDDFSTWLEPHESPNTEVILLGHSMGGILGAEVALVKPSPPAGGKSLLHRILGTINFDTPFLGMHPGVVGAGLGSMFRSAPEQHSAKSPGSDVSGANTPAMSSQASVSSQSFALPLADSNSTSQLSLVERITSHTSSPPPKDLFFDQPFVNDVRLPERKGLSNLLHFISKHSDGLTIATKEYFMSHLEFGGAMADYSGLKNRYQSIRALEDVDDISRGSGQVDPSQNRRVRFVNYYTASSGRPKAPKTPPTPPTPASDDDGDSDDDDESLRSTELEVHELQLNRVRDYPESQTPSIMVEAHATGAVAPRSLEETIDVRPTKEQIEFLGGSSGVQQDLDEPPPMQHIDSMPMDDDEEFGSAEPVNYATTEVSQTPSEEVKKPDFEVSLPPVPDAPTEPDAVNFDLYADKDARKIAEKEHKRAMKAYQQAVKDRDDAIKDRKKLIDKREKKAKQDQEKEIKAAEKQRAKEEKEKGKQLSGEEKRLAEEAKRVAAEEKRMADEAERLAGKHSDFKTEKKEHEQQASASKSKAKGKERERQPSNSPPVEDNKPKRDKKFCMLPPKYGGKIDKCWVRIYMEGVDEVGAHCGLFFAGPQYEGLVGDVGARIGNWVEDDATRRAIIAAEAY